mgnify:CR=1 FL=1
MANWTKKGKKWEWDGRIMSHSEIIEFYKELKLQAPTLEELEANHKAISKKSKKDETK